MGLIRRLIALVPEVRRPLVGLVGLLLAITATYVGQAVLIAQALGAVLVGQQPLSAAPMVAGVLVLQAVRSAAFVARESLGLRAAGLVKRELRQRLVGKLLELGPGWRQSSRTGAMQSVLVDGVETVEPLVAKLVPQLFAAVLGAVALTAFMIVLDPLVGAIILACALLVPAATVLSRRLHDGRMNAWFAGYRRMYAETLDALQGMATLKAFNASRRRGAELDREARAFCVDSIRLVAVVVVFVGVVAFAIGIGTSVAVGVGAVQLTLGALAAAELLLILLLARECFRPLTDLEKAYHSSYSAVPAITGIFELLDTEPDIAEPTEPADQAVVPRPPSVVFDEVSFAYRERGRPALDRFSLEIGAGERVALVGRSGAGKTTVVSLLLRFFEHAEGRILIGGRDIRELPVAGLRRLVAVVAQDTYLFHGTVRRNLELARPGGSDAELAAAAILVLDEATSSVDAVNEAGIQHAAEALTGGRTTLIIAHRLSTVRSADRVVVLDEGRVVEAGEHHALLAERGAYAELVAAQQGAQ